MKLSDIKGTRTLDVIANVIEPICNIAEDDEAATLFKREKLPDGMTVKKFLLQRAKTCIPVLLRDHKQDLIAIFAAIEGVTLNEYGDELDLPKLFKDFVELLTDDVFRTFFISAQSEKDVVPSGSAQENTEGH